MRIDRVYNNNVVQAIDEQENEIIVMGRGIGFQKKVGDTIDDDLVEKIFRLENSQTKKDLSRVYSELNSQEIDFVLSLIKKAEMTLNDSFDPAVYVALADHIHYLIERSKEGLFLNNPLSWEIKKFYYLEYQLALEGIKELSQLLGVMIDVDEAISIALHFINAQKDGKLHQKNKKISKLIMGISEIIRLEFGLIYDENSIGYNRLMTHLQYFAQRVVNNSIQGTNDTFLYEQVRNNYPLAFSCTEKIKTYVLNHYGFMMGEDEQVYLTIHIQRLLK